MNEPDKKLADSTDSVHAGTAGERPHHALSSGIAQTATYTFASTADLVRYMRGEDPDEEREEYGRYGNPTVRELERRLAALEAAEDAVAFSSGMAALTTTLLALCKTGDHIILFRDCYRRTRQLVTHTLSRFGIDHTLVPPGDLEALDQAFQERTRLIVSESPTNPFLSCLDLERLVQVAHAHGRVRTIVDSTFATPINCRPLAFGVDLVVHSATKYLSGHNDVLGGLVAGSGSLISLLREARGVLGSVLDPHAAFLIGRGLKTLGVRVQRQNTTALELARRLEAHPRVTRVYYPGLQSHPSHAVAAAQLRGGGGVVSFIVEGGREAASQVVDRCRLARIAPSLGGVETLVEQPAIMSYFGLSDGELSELEIDPALIRLAVGIEETEALIEDVLSALASS